MRLAGITIAAIALVWALVRVNRDIDQAFAWGEWPALHPEFLGSETVSEMAGGGGGRRKADRLGNRTQRTSPFRTGDGS